MYKAQNQTSTIPSKNHTKKPGIQTNEEVHVSTKIKKA